MVNEKDKLVYSPHQLQSVCIHHIGMAALGARDIPLCDILSFVVFAL